MKSNVNAPPTRMEVLNMTANTEAKSTLVFEGKEYSLEEIQEIQKSVSEMTKLVKEAKKEGIIAKKVIAKVDDPRKLLLADLFRGTIESNFTDIVGLFTETKTAEKPEGNIGINIMISGIEFDVQLLSGNARDEKVKSAKAAKAEAKAEAELERVTAPESEDTE